MVYLGTGPLIQDYAYDTNHPLLESTTRIEHPTPRRKSTPSCCRNLSCIPTRIRLQNNSSRNIPTSWKRKKSPRRKSLLWSQKYSISSVLERSRIKTTTGTIFKNLLIGRRWPEHKLNSRLSGRQRWSRPRRRCQISWWNLMEATTLWTVVCDPC